MTSTHASAPTWTRVRAGLYRSTAGHAAERLTADTAPGLSGRWRLTHDGSWWGDWSTLAAACESVAAVSHRVAALDALPTDDEPAIVRAGQAAPLAAQDAPRQDLDGEVRYDEQGNARYWTAAEVAAEQAAETARRRALDDARPENLPNAAHRYDPAVELEAITDRRELLALVEVEVRRLGYRNAAHYLQAPGREMVRARAEVAAYAPDGPPMPVGVGGCDCPADDGPHLAHCDDCSAPADACVCAPVRA